MKVVDVVLIILISYIPCTILGITSCWNQLP